MSGELQEVGWVSCGRRSPKQVGKREQRRRTNDEIASTVRGERPGHNASHDFEHLTLCPECESFADQLQRA